MTVFITGQLCFIHVPKTAGTTLRSILEQHFHADAIAPRESDRKQRPECYFHLPSLVEQVGFERLHRSLLIRGHLPYHELLGVLPERPFAITLLRHPIRRALSEILHHQRHNQARFAHLSLEEMIRHHPQCYREQWRYFGATLSEAITTLETFDHVGIQEYFPDSVARLATQLHWPVPETLPIKNQADNYPSTLSLEALDLLIQALESDMEFYARALARFKKTAS